MPEKKKTPKKTVTDSSTPKAPRKKTSKEAAPAEVPAEQRPAAKKAASKKPAAKKPAAAKRNGAAASGFSLDEALAIAKRRESEEDKKKASIEAKERARRAIEDAEEKSEKRVLGVASLADILGYNPSAPAAPKRDEKLVPKKWEPFYRLLVELRNHVRQGLNLHTEETLKRSSKDDTGDLSSYGQHMADAGTDTFDRDFALSMVSSEQEALQEVEAAIDRIFNGTYGICEMTGKQIRDERLMAIPFTRYSLKTQEQLEKNRIRSQQRGGVFTDASSDDSISFGDENPDV